VGDLMSSVVAWLSSWHAELYLITGVLAVVWAMTEIASTFAVDPGRALRTRGAAILLIVNAVFACLALAATLALDPKAATPWLALGVGLAWQTFIRTRLNFIQPLPGEGARESVGIPFNELYTRLQDFCRRQIDREIVGERVRLIEMAVDQLDLQTLARRARLVLSSSVVAGGKAEADGNTPEYIDKILNDTAMADEAKEIMLIATIIEYGGTGFLRETLRKEAVARRNKK
jgi:hypothetical protein